MNPRTCCERSAVVEPIDAHSGITHRLNSTIEMARSGFLDLNVFELDSKSRWIRCFLFRQNLVPLVQRFLQFLNAFRTGLEVARQLGLQNDTLTTAHLKLARYRGFAVAISSFASVQTRVALIAIRDFQNDKTEIVNRLDPATSKKRLAIVEPFYSHARIVNRL